MARTRITAKQKSARRRNIKIAQQAHRSGGSRQKQVRALKKSGLFKPKDLKGSKLFSSSKENLTKFSVVQKLHAASGRKRLPKNFKYKK